jgi:hypothetical protein
MTPLEELKQMRDNMEACGFERCLTTANRALDEIERLVRELATKPNSCEWVYATALSNGKDVSYYLTGCGEEVDVPWGMHWFEDLCWTYCPHCAGKIQEAPRYTE